MNGLGPIYLAHPITETNEDVKESTLNLISSITRMGYTVLDPEDYDLDDDVDYKEIVRRNIQDITKSDIMVAICTHPSFGIGGELVMAKMVGTPVVALVKNMSYRQSAWLTNHTNWVVDRIDSVVSIVKSERDKQLIE